MPTSNGSQEDLLHPARLQLDVVIAGCVPPGEVRARESGRSREGRDERVVVEGIHEHTRLRRHELGRAADGRGDDGAADAMASSVARPKGSSTLGWQSTSHAAIQAGTASWPTRPTSWIPGRFFERGAERAVADEHE